MFCRTNMDVLKDFYRTEQVTIGSTRVISL